MFVLYEILITYYILRNESICLFLWQYIEEYENNTKLRDYCFLLRIFKWVGLEPCGLLIFYLFFTL